MTPWPDVLLPAGVVSPCGTLLEVRSKSPIDNFAPDRLRALRQRAGLTAARLAERARVPRPNISGYESGTRPIGFETLVNLADALGVDPLALTTADPNAPTLADLRLRARRSRVELAAAAAVSYDTWYAIETGRRRLTDDVAGRVAAALAVDVTELRAAHDRTRLTDRQLRVGHPTTTARHFALRHRLPAPVAATAPTPIWAQARVSAYLAAAGLDPAGVTMTTTPDAFSAATGIAIGPADHGMASWEAGRQVLYVDPVKAGTCARLEQLIAHEVGHLRWPRLGHRARFFQLVQQLLDTAASD